MPFALVLIGLAMVITGAKGTYLQFGAQIQKDFTGEGNFLYWAASVGMVGAVGYVKDIQPLSRIFLVLILLALVLSKSNASLFSQLTTALAAGPIHIQAPAYGADPNNPNTGQATADQLHSQGTTSGFTPNADINTLGNARSQPQTFNPFGWLPTPQNGISQLFKFFAPTPAY